MAIDKDTAWISVGVGVDCPGGTMIIVEHCPHCAAPLYAPNIWRGADPPPVYHTCECRNYRPLSDYLPQSAPIPEGTGQPPWSGESPSYDKWGTASVPSGYSPLEVDMITHPEKYGRPTKTQQVGTQSESTADTVV